MLVGIELQMLKYCYTVCLVKLQACLLIVVFGKLVVRPSCIYVKSLSSHKLRVRPVLMGRDEACFH